MRSGCFLGLREWVGAPLGGWEEEGDPVPMMGSRVSASGPGRQQAWSPEPSRTPVLRSGQEGQVMFDSQQGRSLVLVTTWFAMYTSGSPALSPGELLGGAASVCVELVMAKPPLLLFLQDTRDVLQLQPHQELPPLTGGLSFPCLKATAFPELKYFERT